jgi:hypothetical protein
MAEQGNTLLAKIIVGIINISLLTSRPLHRWLRSAQIMLEKGKGKYIENLRIIQLCEADINFVLNAIWGYRLTCNGVKQKIFNQSQYAMPGLTCNSAIWSKVLYCDMTRQTLKTGILTDYDATAAFDCVLHALSVITCRRLGLPMQTGQFIYNLLHNMEFHLITGYGKSIQHFKNNEDPGNPGQGMLQGSSSAAPIYNFNTDVSLNAYHKLATGATFTHPTNKHNFTIHATQFVDDKAEMINVHDVEGTGENITKAELREKLYMVATEYTNIWAQLLWVSGGNLNPNKCFHYYLDPTYSYTKQKIQYGKQKTTQGQIFLNNPATNSSTAIERVEPSEGRRTLGVILAPDGNCSKQIKHCYTKAVEYIGKIKQSKLSNVAKWKAANTILDAQIQYPLMATLCSRKDLDKLDKPIMKFKCSALGLNEHFPRAILHGPMELGGLGIPTKVSKTVTQRVNYFLYHMRQGTTVGEQLEITRAFLQMEIGLCQNVLEVPYETYGHLGTKSLIKTIWSETEPNGMFLKPHTPLDTPLYQGHLDIEIMRIACQHLSKRDSTIINRYHLYLQVTTLYDIIIYSDNSLHPQIIRGERIESRTYHHAWVNFKSPPKRYLRTWKQFIETFIKPALENINIRWDTNSHPNYENDFQYCPVQNKLYQKIAHGYLEYKPRGRQTHNRIQQFQKTTQLIQLPPDITLQLQEVEVSHERNAITILGSTSIKQHRAGDKIKPSAQNYRMHMIDCHALFNSFVEKTIFHLTVDMASSNMLEKPTHR